MFLLRKALLGLFFFVMPLYAIANTTILSVPFQNISLNPNDTIVAHYAFGLQPIIFCYENNQQTVGMVTWSYRGIMAVSTLPITLVTNANYEGSFADSSGMITVTNNQRSSLIVSCEFAF